MSELTPIVTVEASRKIEVIKLADVEYQVRHPKMHETSDIQESVREISQSIKKDGGELTVDGLSNDDIAQLMAKFWEYLKISLYNQDDYAAIRRRVAGDISDELAESTEPFSKNTGRDGNDDPLDTTDVVVLVQKLLEHWSPKQIENPTQQVGPQPSKMKKAAAANKATVRKRSR